MCDTDVLKWSPTWSCMCVCVIQCSPGGSLSVKCVRLIQWMHGDRRRQHNTIHDNHWVSNDRTELNVRRVTIETITKTHTHSKTGAKESIPDHSVSLAESVIPDTYTPLAHNHQTIRWRTQFASFGAHSLVRYVAVWLSHHSHSHIYTDQSVLHQTAGALIVASWCFFYCWYGCVCSFRFVLFQIAACACTEIVWQLNKLRFRHNRPPCVPVCHWPHRPHQDRGGRFAIISKHTIISRAPTRDRSRFVSITATLDSPASSNTYTRTVF